jgi:hypothetical protein
MKLVVPSMKRRRKKKRNIISFSQKMILPQVDDLEKVPFVQHFIKTCDMFCHVEFLFRFLNKKVKVA